MTLSSSENFSQLPPITWGRGLLLSTLYSSYVICLLYAVVMWRSSFSVAQEVYLFAGSASPPAWYTYSISAVLFVLAASDVVVNFAVVHPPELAYRLSQPKGSSMGDVNKSVACLSLSVFVCNVYFLVGSSSTMVALMEFTSNVPLVASIGAIFTVLGWVFYNLLFTGSIRMHHNRYYTNLCANSAKTFSLLTKKPALAIEAMLQVFSSSFYSAITFSFFLVNLLHFYGSDSSLANIIAISFCFVCSFYGSAFTKTIDTFNFYLKDLGLANKKSFDVQQFVFSFFRTIGLVFLMVKYVPEPYSIPVALVAGTLLLVQAGRASALLPSRRFLRPEASKHPKAEFALNVVNIMGRSLRVISTVAFVLVVSNFIFRNLGVRHSMGILEAVMISLAALGVEANNYHFYRRKVKDSVDLLARKLELDANYRMQHKLGGGFFWRCLLYTKDEYPSLMSDDKIPKA